jgi:hypothetical protein
LALHRHCEDPTGSERAPDDRLRDDNPSRRRKKQWIVSSQVLLAMTATEVRGVDYEA